ncbi:trypsin-like serine protease [Corynebacterium simulans]|uniref:trypsin-like serine protease n=1 Tax=Corynebacterium simulans TaxID=146827 RepID=UPI001911C198|nr:trypsin-like serine protease [Corynebacterium simulans]MDK7139199.1 trypsin-like serine protease [Corynebacterium simulans]
MAIYRSANLVQARTYDTPDGSPHKCTGTAIAPEWILTAAHCVEGPTFSASDILKVSFSNNKLDPGPSISVGRQQNKWSKAAWTSTQRLSRRASHAFITGRNRIPRPCNVSDISEWQDERKEETNSHAGGKPTDSRSSAC